MMDRYRQGLEITNDDEWKVIETLVGKVMDARREVGGGGFGGGRRRGGGNGGGTAAGTGTGTTGGNAGGTADAQAAGNGGQGGGRGGFNRPPNPEADALQSALDSKASSDELKAKLSKFREARKEKEAKLQAAQDDLRKVLTVRQEAAAVLAGLLQ